MANATAGVKRNTVPSNLDNLRFPVSVVTSQTFYPMAAVGLNSLGAIVKCDDTAALKWAGFNAGARIVIDTTETAGAILMDVERPKYFTALIDSAAVTDVGRAVYWKYDNEVSFSAGTYGNKAGVVAWRLSATEVLVESARWEASFSDDDGENWHVVEDDFDHYTDAEEWTLVTDASGTAAIADAVNGIMTLTAGGSAGDNKDAYLEKKLESYLFAASKPIHFKARVLLNEVTANEANILVGLMDAVAADHLLDNGGGPAASYSGVVFFKVDGGAVWQGEVSVAGTQVTDTGVGSYSDNAYQWLEFVWIPTSSTSATAYFYVDGVLGGTCTHTYTSGTEMQIVFGVKNGNGSNNLALLIDYVKCKQIR